jgi:hypothetical protein
MQWDSRPLMSRAPCLYYAQHPEITYSVKYKKGPGERPEDTLAKGESVKVKDGMIFYVSETGQS